ncbi:MAG: HlyD family efflux transporter periplasmic adaptor subunit [Kofleriaceae bacterium]|nr:HlyD family efflux transporter periplasmic adaptor subunit [Kofleriaceae bacterium]
MNGSAWISDEHDNNHVDLGLALVPRGRALRIAGRIVIIAFVAVAAALWFAPWQQSVRGGGRVIAYAPLERQQTIKATIAGRVARWHVQEGDAVVEGTIVATIEDNDPELATRLERTRDAARERLENARQSVIVYTQQIAQLESARTAAVAAAESRVAMGTERRLAAEQALAAARATRQAAFAQRDRRRTLERDGLTSTRDRELADLAAQTADAEVARAEATLRAARGEVEAMRAERARTEASASADIERARVSLQSARSEVAAYDAALQEREIAVSRQQTMTIVAPRAGTILRQLVTEGGEYVSAGDPIALLVPSTELRAVEMWLDGRDASLVYPGRKVRLQFEGWPAVQFVGWPSVAVGTFGGEVAFVDAAADARGQLRVVVTPDPTDGPWPEGRFLRQGTRANGWVLLDRVRLGYELWRQWNGFPPATNPPPPDATSSDGKMLGAKSRTKGDLP